MSSEPRAAPGPVTRTVAEGVARICATRRRAGLVVLAALLLAALALWFGLGIHVDTDLRALLPPTAPSVAALETIEARKGSAEELVVAIEAPAAADAEAMVEGLAAEIASWPETLELATGRDYTSVRDHALYMLDLDELRRLRDALEDERARAVARALGPGLGGGEVDVDAVRAGESWDAPELDTLDWSDDAPAPSSKPGERERGGERDEIQAFLDEQRAALSEDGRLTPDEVALIWPEHDEAGELPWRERVGQPFATRGGTVRTIHASLTIPATDVEFATELQARIEGRAAALRESGIAPSTRAEIVAAYDVSGAVDTILADARRATWISGTLVLAALLLGLRRLRALILVAVPMAVAVALTLAAARLAFAELNALTVFLFAVLFGMGVDFSVHLFALRERQGPQADWPELIREHLRPLAATMATTAASLAVLTLAEFRAFVEFGAISAVGVVLCFVCAVVLVPAIDVLLGPLRRIRSSSEAATPAGTEQGGTEQGGTEQGTRGIGPARVAILVGLTGLALWGAPKLELEDNIRELNRSDAVARVDADKPIPYGATGGQRKTLVLVADSPEQLAIALERLREVEAAGELLPGGVELPEVPRRPWVRRVYDLATLMPSDQPAKAEVLAEIATLANGFLAELPDLDADAWRHRSHLEALERLATAAPMQIEELPSWALEPFVEHDGRGDRIAHVELSIVGHHIDELVALRHRLDELLAGTRVQAADSRLVFADLMILVERDARRLPIYALVIIALFIAVNLRRPIPALACLGSLALGLGLTLAIMGLWPLRLNFFNLVVMPAVIGLGIDASLHLWHARARASLATTGRASIVAALTTVGGFSGLLAADHAGLRSIGEVGVVAIVACVGVAFLGLYPGRW